MEDKKIYKSIIYLCVLWFGVAIQFSLLYYWTYWINASGTIVTHVFQILGDASIIVLPYVLLPRRFRWTELLITGVLVATMYANLCYYPYFREYISVTIFTNLQLVDDTVWTCAKDAMRWKHCLLLLIYIGYAGLYITWRKDIVSERYSCRTRLILGCALLLLIIASIAKAIRNAYVYHGGVLNVNEMLHEHVVNYVDCNYFSFVGFIGNYSYAGAYLRTFVSPVDKVELTDEIIEEINTRFPSLPSDVSYDESGPSMNMIFIVVESLNSRVIDMTFNNKDGERVDVMPRMKALAVDSARNGGVITWVNMLSQVGVGGSSDGQFMYNTGLIPLSKIPVVTHFGDVSYPSLAKSIPDYFQKWEVIGEKDNSWNHRTTTKSYGYDELVCDLVPSDGISYKMREDSMIFARAFHDFSGRFGKPEFMFVTTLGMHTPYLHAIAPESVEANKDVTNPEAVYLSLCNAFDKALGCFVDSLTAHGMYDKTIIGIASDHTVPFGFLPDDYNSDNAMFMLINAPRTKKNGIQTDVVGQIDVFPTLLDCLGVYETSRWKGFGRSLLGEELPEVFDDARGTAVNGIYDADRTLSEKIIKSEYFKINPVK